MPAVAHGGEIGQQPCVLASCGYGEVLLGGLDQPHHMLGVLNREHPGGQAEVVRALGEVLAVWEAICFGCASTRL